VRTKIKNVMTGAVTERTFRPTEKFPAASIDRIDMQYLYKDGDMYNFMNTESYDQISLGPDVVGDAMKFVKENEMVKVAFPTTERCSPWSRRFLWNSRSRKRSPDLPGNTAQGASASRHRGNRCAGFRTAFHQSGRQDQDRYAYGRISWKSIKNEQVRAVPNRGCLLFLCRRTNCHGNHDIRYERGSWRKAFAACGYDDAGHAKVQVSATAPTSANIQCNGCMAAAKKAAHKKPIDIASVKFRKRY
jgi:hypothetical protein